MSDGSIVNLTVHGIGPAPRELDPGEDRTWISVEGFEQALDIVVERSDIRLTFDDGNASDVDIALPRLLERGLTAEFFVLAGRLGESGRVDVSDVRELAAAGMAVGSHGWAHRDWRSLTADQAQDEIERAPREIERILDRPVARVAIPFGSYDRPVLRRLRRAGVERVYTSDGGRTAPHVWLQSRTSLRHDTTRAHLTELLDGHPSPLARCRRAAKLWVKRYRP